MVYKTKGVCSQEIHFELDGDVIKHVEFIGGCSGNTQGVARLVEGMKTSDAIARLEGIKCGFRPTSCPDQLATALKLALEQNK
ncbi:MAG: TIGR03905 family TSCPD domain-containing protein [Lachnospiraceae bacterium]|nr:TIGR03905 family TSCPD domain-containing protein [Lachnospiraceae bacterium]